MTRSVLVAALAVTLLVSAVPVSGQSLESQRPRCAHEPIRIDGDHGPQGFTWTNPMTGDDEHRPGSGVVAGNGTAENPFVIEGWCIAPGPSSVFETALTEAIRLEDTESHVIVRDNVVRGAGHGVRLADTKNVTIRNNTVLDSGEAGIYGGKFPDGERALVVEDNRIHRAEFGIIFDGDTSPREIRLENNTVREVEAGVGIGGDDVEIRRNDVDDAPRYGLFAIGSNVTVAENVVRNASDAGRFSAAIVMGGTGVLASNTIQGSNGTGVVFDGGSDAVFRDNVVSGHEQGIEVDAGADDLVLQGNNIQDNAVGLNATGTAGPLDARNNWWGDASGPSGGVESGCSDAVADGDGQAILADDGAVCFEDWLQAPNPDAGVTTR